MAAAAVSQGNYAEAVKQYAPLVAARPDDARLHLAYGEALLGDRQYATACAELEKLKDKGLGYRDLGLPAARACMLKGDGDAAIAWLRSIPQRFLPSDIETDPVFEPLRSREEFRALFKR
jgi:predicted Zn-dependent protease